MIDRDDENWVRIPQRWGASSAHQIRRHLISICFVTGDAVARASPHPRGEDIISALWRAMYQRIHEHINKTSTVINTYFEEKSFVVMLKFPLKLLPTNF